MESLKWKSEAKISQKSVSKISNLKHNIITYSSIPVRKFGEIKITGKNTFDISKVFNINVGILKDLKNNSLGSSYFGTIGDEAENILIKEHFRESIKELNSTLFFNIKTIKEGNTVLHIFDCQKLLKSIIIKEELENGVVCKLSVILPIKSFISASDKDFEKNRSLSSFCALIFDVKNTNKGGMMVNSLTHPQEILNSFSKEIFLHNKNLYYEMITDIALSYSADIFLSHKAYKTALNSYKKESISYFRNDKVVTQVKYLHNIKGVVIYGGDVMSNYSNVLSSVPVKSNLTSIIPRFSYSKGSSILVDERKRLVKSKEYNHFEGNKYVNPNILKGIGEKGYFIINDRFFIAEVEKPNTTYLSSIHLYEFIYDKDTNEVISYEPRKELFLGDENKFSKIKSVYVDEKNSKIILSVNVFNTVNNAVIFNYSGSIVDKGAGQISTYLIIDTNDFSMRKVSILKGYEEVNIKHKSIAGFKNADRALVNSHNSDMGNILYADSDRIVVGYDFSNKSIYSAEKFNKNIEMGVNSFPGFFNIFRDSMSFEEINEGVLFEIPLPKNISINSNITSIPSLIKSFRVSDGIYKSIDYNLLEGEKEIDHIGDYFDVLGDNFNTFRIQIIKGQLVIKEIEETSMKNGDGEKKIKRIIDIPEHNRAICFMGTYDNSDFYGVIYIESLSGTNGYILIKNGKLLSDNIIYGPIRFIHGTGFVIE